MGPRHFSRGINVRMVCPCRLHHASMGPRHFSRGIMDRKITITAPNGCFNGATAFQPWNSPSFTAALLACRCFNGATAFQPWNSACLCAQCRRSEGFNGATAFQPWNCKADSLVTMYPCASMGPRHFSRGIIACSAISSSTAPLQWGHGISAVEFR